MSALAVVSLSLIIVFLIVLSIALFVILNDSNIDRRSLRYKINCMKSDYQDLNESYDRLYAAYVKLSAGNTSQTSNKKSTRPKTHWEILKIKPTDDRDEIMRAFWEMAKKHHPDRGGKPENFRKVVEAKDKCFEEMDISV